MGKYCPYTDQTTVYLSCVECDAKICEPSTFFCLVTGSDAVADKQRFSAVLDCLLQNQHAVALVTNGSTEIETMMEEYGTAHGYPILSVPSEDNPARMHLFLAKQAKRGIVLFGDPDGSEAKQTKRLAKMYANPVRCIRC